MRWMGKLRRRARLFFHRDVAERDMDDEMRFHLEMEAQELGRGGLREEDARRQALRSFGGVERYKEESRDARGGRLLDDVRQDVRYAARVLARSRGFTTVAVLTLALGVGANTAMFSVVRGVILRPLPYADPERLASLASDIGGRRTAVSARDFLDWRDQARSFSGMTAYFLSTTNLTGITEPERLTQARVSANAFDVLGVRAQIGRIFAPGEDELSSPRVAVLSDGLWRRRFGADKNIVGRTLVLDGFPTAVIGVAPPDVRFPAAVDLWMTTRFDAKDVSPSARGARWLDVVARLAPGATMAAARSEMAAIAARLAVLDPVHNTGFTTHVAPLQEDLVASVRTPLLVLLGSVGFVMLIACVNVASLSLGRTAAREAELAVRGALGAQRARIARQLLCESLVLSLAGGLAGVGLAVLGMHGLLALAPGDIPRLEDVRLDGPVLAFAFGVTLLSGVLFGVVPALRGSSSALASGLRAGGRVGERVAGANARRALVVAEVALAIVLLAGAGLLLRSFERLREVDPGFRSAGVSTFTVDLSPVRYPNKEQRALFATAMLDGLRRLPGVEAAAASFGLPLSGSGYGLTFEIRGRPSASGPDEPRAQVRVASAEYFRAMGIPLLRGRGFTAEDRPSGQRVVVISRETARRYWPNEDPIGHVITTGWHRDSVALGGVIVGVVGDVRQFGLDIGPTPHVYALLDQWPLDELSVVLKASSPAPTVLAGARDAVRALDAELPVYDAGTLDQLVAESLGQRRFYSLLLAGFAAVALALAAIGIYGVIAYSVQQRRREIGIRIALGASRERVVGMVVRQAMTLVLLGAGVGLLGAVGLTGLLRQLLFSVTATDPVTFAAVPALLVAVAAVACAVPARRAVRVDPASTIRAEN